LARRLKNCPIDGQFFTSVGKKGERRRGYYSAEEVFEDGKAKKKRLGEHMKNALPHEPHPGAEPLRQNCPEPPAE
jgi:hypothetical protein